MFEQRLYDADMSKAARGAAAENEPDRWPPGFAMNGLGSDIGDGHAILYSCGPKAFGVMIRRER
jgi:hypothetical protein